MGRYRQHLPESFLEVSGDSFACMSLHARGKPLGVVYVDKGEKNLSAQDFASFKAVMQIANQSLKAVPSRAKV